MHTGNPRRAPASARLQSLLLLVIGALYLCCGQSDPQLTLVLTVSGVPMPAAGYQLKVTMRLDGKLQAQPTFTVPDSMPRFAVTVPVAADRTSALEVQVAAETPGGCRLGDGSKVVSISKDYAGGEIDLQITPLARARCPLTLSVSGDGSITISPGGQRCTGSCTFDFDTGTMLSLIAATGATSTPGTWSGGCGPGPADMPCAVRMDRALAVMLTLPLRPCSPDGVCSYSLPSGVSAGLSAIAPANSALTEFWAAGTGGTVISTTGSEWIRVPSPLPVQNVLALSGTSTQTMYFGGSASVDARTSLQLTSLACSFTVGATVRGAWSFANVRSWFVGDGGQIATFTNPTCTQTSSQTPNTLHAVSGIDLSFVMAVGDQGTITRFDGTQWAVQASPTISRLRALSFDSKTSGWAAGGGGTLLRWNGAAWTQVSSGVTADLYGVLSRGATEAWAVGDSGVLLRFDGASWLPVALPASSSANLRGVAGNAVDTWTVGASGEIFRVTKK